MRNPGIGESIHCHEAIGKQAFTARSKEPFLLLPTKYCQ